MFKKRYDAISFRCIKVLLLLLTITGVCLLADTRTVEAEESVVAQVLKEGDEVAADYTSCYEAWYQAVTTSVNDKKPVTITLQADWNYEKNDSSGKTNAYRPSGSILVPSGADITLDLNGHAVGRQLTDAISGGEVFYVQGTFTIINSPGATAKGYIRGGNSTESGGLMFITDSAKVSVNGCILEGGTAKNGGAIYMNNGTATISNCTFQEDYATENGGAVYYQGGTLRLANFNAKTCGAGKAGGGAYINNNSCKIIRCNITECEAPDGAGIFVAGGRSLGLKEKIIVSGNQIPDHSKECDITLQNSNGKAYIMDGGMAYDSQISINFVGGAQSWTFIKNASTYKVKKGIYAVNPAYHSNPMFGGSMSNEPMKVGAYSGSIIGQGGNVLWISLLVILVLACAGILLIKRASAKKE